MDSSDKLRLLSDHMERSRLQHGPQRGKLVPCGASVHHPHHPDSEACSWCPPPKRLYGREYYEHCCGTEKQADWAYRSSPPSWEVLDDITRTVWHELAEQDIALMQSLYGARPLWFPDGD